MDNRLYSRILNSIGNEVKYAIREQFNIGDLDLNDEEDGNADIFNKFVVNP